jgi:predicted nucleic acid-binding protein
LLLARCQGLIEAVKPVVRSLREAGYHLSDRLVDAVLRQAGERW